MESRTTASDAAGGPAAAHAAPVSLLAEADPGTSFLLVLPLNLLPELADCTAELGKIFLLCFQTLNNDP